MTIVASTGGVLRGFLALAALAALGAAAAVTLRPELMPDLGRASGPAAPGAEAPAAPEGVVCFGTVDLERGVTALAPLRPGRVAEVPVAEGDRVEEDAVLLRLDDRAARGAVEEAEAALDLARLALDEARKLPDRYRTQVEAQEASLEAAANRLVAARDLMARRREVPQQQPAVAAIEAAAAELEARELEALERAEVRRLAELKARDPDAEARRAEFELKAAEQRLAQARHALDECEVKAPRAGTVLRINVGPGDVVAAERPQPALMFAADGPRIVRASVEQEFARRIAVGAPAEVRDEADPDGAWRGRVARVADWYAQRRVVLHDPTQLSDVRTLECAIVLDDDQPPLRLGQGVRVFIGIAPP